MNSHLMQETQYMTTFTKEESDLKTFCSFANENLIHLYY